MKQNILIALMLVVAAFYFGSVIGKDHPIDILYEEAITSINDAELINFKSLLVVEKLDADNDIDAAHDADIWHYKRQGVYDVSSGDLHYLNVRNYQYDDGDPRNKEEDTSLSFTEAGRLITLPIQEAYYQKPVISLLNRESGQWSDWGLADFRLLELLPFDADIINRQVTLTDSENRGKFVVYSFDVDLDYLTRNFSRILLADDLNFPATFVAAEFKILIYQDTTLTRRIYSDFLIENKDTGQRYSFQLDTYFSANESLDYFKES